VESGAVALRHYALASLPRYRIKYSLYVQLLYLSAAAYPSLLIDDVKELIEEQTI
jgi:hypothetical protein